MWFFGEHNNNYDGEIKGKLWKTKLKPKTEPRRMGKTQNTTATAKEKDRVRDMDEKATRTQKERRKRSADKPSSQT